MSIALSPFGFEKGNNETLPEGEEMEELNLDFISEKSSEESSDIAPVAKQRKNSADCSDSEDGKIIEDDKHRKTI